MLHSESSWTMYCIVIRCTGVGWGPRGPEYSSWNKSKRSRLSKILQGYVCTTCVSTGWNVITCGCSAESRWYSTKNYDCLANQVFDYCFSNRAVEGCITLVSYGSLVQKNKPFQVYCRKHCFFQNKYNENISHYNILLGCYNMTLSLFLYYNHVIGRVTST